MLPLLAQAPAADSWTVVNALGILLALALSSISFVRNVSGKGGERQVEPTVLANISAKLDEQSITLSDINREVGETKTEVRSNITSLNEQMAGMHHRVGSISRDLAHTVARVDGLERREDRGHA